ncbi:MAG: FecR domain-containing protein, partial [Prevotella sp.]|nr:FecR domain-containing protein [Prevotella sp.]
STVSSATAATEIMLTNKAAAEKVQDTDSPEAILDTHHDKEFWMTLDDGTHVHLNYNSSLSYPIHFKGKERRVVLEGEAYFFVAKDDSHPFVVTTPYGDIRDYGTEFCVNTKPQQGGASVVLVKGKIGVVPNNGRETILHPGEKAELTANHFVSVTKADINSYVAWNTGQFFFDGCTLEELTDVISRWYNISVVFESDDIKSMRFTGDINKYDNILPTIHAIKEVTDVDITLLNGVMTIKGKE